MESEDNKFALQVTPELVLKLSRDLDGSKKPRPSRGKPATSKTSLQKQNNEQDLPVGVWPPVAPVFPGFLPTVPGPVVGQGAPAKHSQEHESELEKMRSMLHESEKVGESLHRNEKAQLEKVKKVAQDLQDKQYRAPSRPVPCFEERQACVQCYLQNIKEPLQCAKSVQAFVDCSRRAQQDFITTSS